jgi:ATP-dependent helicase/nuclease subunit A
MVLDEVVDPNRQQQRHKVWRPARPGDFLVLVKRRQYLPEYEEALRHANLLFESPRLGGLLETLEVDDLIALLTILSNPNHDLALAQVLRSPLYGLNEGQMQTLSELVQSNRGYRNWWEALTHANDHRYAEVFLGIAKQLIAWMELAKHLPVHDLLDHVYFSGDIRCKYASVCQARDRDQVLANLDAFLELALNLDGGRYPSLGRFITQLKQMRRGDQDETPDEGEMRGEVPLEDENDELEDGDFDLDSHSITHRQQRIRLMTIHGAKGLEAPFVIILDCNHTAITNPGRGVLLDWDPDRQAPDHLSMFTKLSLSKAREDLLAQEKDIALHENWNLFYVALTRAKQGLWLSGVESTRNRQQGGLVPDSWYERACEGQVPVFTELDEAQVDYLDSSRPQSSQSDKPFEYPDLVLTWQGLPNPTPGLKTYSVDEQRRMQEGEWFHALLERVTPAQYRVAQAIPDAQLLAKRLGMNEASAQRTIERTHSVCNSPELLSFFDPKIYRNAWNELDIVSEERCLRIDRLVEFENELVVLDYKLSIPEKTDPLYSQYQVQLERYCQAVRRLFPDKRVRSLLIDGQGHSTDLLA